jgi:hypothetical protein
VKIPSALIEKDGNCNKRFRKDFLVFLYSAMFAVHFMANGFL